MTQKTTGDSGAVSMTPNGGKENNKGKTVSFAPQVRGNDKQLITGILNWI
jgi:hypothetical protein